MVLNDTIVFRLLTIKVEKSYIITLTSFWFCTSVQNWGLYVAIANYERNANHFYRFLVRHRSVFADKTMPEEECHDRSTLPQDHTHTYDPHPWNRYLPLSYLNVKSNKVMSKYERIQAIYVKCGFIFFIGMYAESS